jgi:hypothetical protein
MVNETRLLIAKIMTSWPRFYALSVPIARLPINYSLKTWYRSTIPVLLLAAACAAPQYDDQTDKLISELQTDVDTEIVSLITLDHKISSLSGKSDAASQRALADAKAKAGYDANTGFYDKVDVDLTSLQTRVDAEPSAATPHLDTAIKDLRDNLLAADGSMQATHQKVGILSEAYLRNVKMLVDAQIGALLTRELGLKSGSSSTSSIGTGDGASNAPQQK